MAYAKKDFNNLKGTPGFSDTALDTHFALYEGYVNNVSKLMETLGKLWMEKRSDSWEFAELRRRFGWEWDGMRLHELYFGNLGGNGELSPQSDLYKKLSEQYKSFENWRNDFLALGKMRGIGWVVLYWDRQADRLFNIWINEHDSGHLAGAVPLLVMDVFEHAYFPDYGKDRPSYIEAFMKNVNWPAVEERLIK